jgi:LuxR family maltose regulon positive regulatory protein
MLTRQTEGWVVGLQLVAISLRNKINTMPATQLLEGVQGTQFMIADYLVEEVLAQQSAEVRAFLQRSCLLDRFNLEMAEFLADWEVAEMPASYDPQESTNILNHLQQSNLFLTALDENHTWFRYHALFAGYIRASLTDSQKRQLYQGASAWCATRGLKHEAIEYAVRAKDYVTVAQLFRQFGGILRGQGEYRALFHWLDSIPRAEVESYLHLRVLKGWAMWYEGDVAGAINQCDRLKPLLQEISDENELASVANFVGFLLYVKGEVKLAKEISQIALQKIDPQNPEIFFSYITYSYCEGCLGNFEGALDINQKLLRLSKQFDRYMDLAFTIRERAVILRHLGRRREAIVSCLQGLDYFVNQRSRTITSSGFVHLALSIHYLDGNELDLARHHLEIAEDLCRHISVLSTKILIWSTWSHLYWVEGEPEKATNALAEADNLLLQYKDQILFLSPHVVAMQLRLGQINSVRHWAEKHELSLGIFPDYKYLTAHLVFARLLLLQNQLSDASNYLQMVSRMARHTKQLWILINARLIQSLVEQKKGNQENAVEYLGQAVRLAEVEGYSRVFLDEGKMLIPLLRLVRPAAPAFVKELLAELGVDEGVERKMPAFSPPSYTTLSQRQIEILQLAANGLTNREIANRLHITIGTTKWHFSQIYRELNVRNRTQAIAKARELAIFSNL